MNADLNLGRYDPRDAAALLALFRDTIHQVNSRDYSPDQISAWADSSNGLESWRARFEGRIAFVAELGLQLVGFVDLAHDGYLDRLYVDATHQREGIATALLESIVREANKFGVRQLRTDASITAVPFFAEMGFSKPIEQTVVCRGVQMTNYRMEFFVETWARTQNSR